MLWPGASIRDLALGQLQICVIASRRFHALDRERDEALLGENEDALDPAGEVAAPRFAADQEAALEHEAVLAQAERAERVLGAPRLHAQAGVMRARPERSLRLRDRGRRDRTRGPAREVRLQDRLARLRVG